MIKVGDIVTVRSEYGGSVRTAGTGVVVKLITTGGINIANTIWTDPRPHSAPQHRQDFLSHLTRVENA